MIGWQNGVNKKILPTVGTRHLSLLIWNFGFRDFTFAAFFKSRLYMKASGNLIVDLTYDFSLKILEYTDSLEQARKFAVANQLTKSRTSIGANVREAQGGESHSDFVHKLKISEKEVFETEYWLMLCRDSKVLPDPGKLPQDIESIKKVLRKILSTCYGKGYGTYR